MSPHQCLAQNRERAAICSCGTELSFKSISYLRIGSAHIQCQPKFDREHIDLMLRLCTYTLGRYEPEQLPAQLQLLFLDDPKPPSAAGIVQATADTQAANATASPLMSSKFTDKRWLPYLFVVILIKGVLPTGEPGYCYLGLFADRLLSWLKQPVHKTHFSPKAVGGIVLRNGRGKPSPFTREWMLQHFRFSQSNYTNLEFSRHGLPD